MIQRKMMFTTMVLLLGAVIMVGSVACDSQAGRAPRMEIAQLLDMIDSPEVMIIDIRSGSDWDGSENMIKNAVRKPHDNDSWMAEIPKDKTIVLY